jgi:hypothetical protein
MFPANDNGHNAKAKWSCEPRLVEIIDEPIVRAVMDADGISIADLRRLLTEAMAVYDTAAPRHMSRSQSAITRVRAATAAP